MILILAIGCAGKTSAVIEYFRYVIQSVAESISVHSWMFSCWNDGELRLAAANLRKNQTSEIQTREV